VGTAEITETVTGEHRAVTYAAFYFGDFNIAAGVRPFKDDSAFALMERAVLETFERDDVTGVIQLIERQFQGSSYSLWHLFKDEQRKVMAQILDSTLGDVERALRQVRDHHYPVIEVMRRMRVPMPRLFRRIAGAIQDIDLIRALEEAEPDIARIGAIAQEAQAWGLELDRVQAEFVAVGHANTDMEVLERLCTSETTYLAESVDLLERIVSFFEAIAPLDLQLDLWKAQNLYFSLGNRMLPAIQKRAGKGDAASRRWCQAFEQLGTFLNVGIA
jgi:hypothetical protein